MLSFILSYDLTTIYVHSLDLTRFLSGSPNQNVHTDRVGLHVNFKGVHPGSGLLRRVYS